MAIGLSKDGKWVFNKACTTPWCHAGVHFEVKMSRFRAVFQDDRPDRGGTSLKQAVFFQRSFPMRYTRLGPSSFLVRVLPSWVYPVEVLHHLLGAKGEQQNLAAAASSRRPKSPCDHTVAQNRHPSSSKRPGSQGASPQTSFVAF